MRKKIMVLSGSPNRDGNTSIIVEWVAEGARKNGAEVEVIDVNLLEYKTNGCTACLGCQKSDKFECVIDDEAKPIIARMSEADVLIFATPVYFFGPSAQLKMFADRMFSLLKFDPESGGIRHNLKGKMFCLVAAAVADDFNILKNTFERIADYFDARFNSLLISDSGPVKENASIKEKAKEFGRNLMC